MKLYSSVCRLTVILLSVFSFSSAASGGYAEYTRSLPFSMPIVKPPVFPDREVRVDEFGGVGDATTLNTKAFESAIRKLSAQGGGRLVVPEGVWLTGPITLLSNIDLHLESGAVILFSDNFDLYPLVDAVFEGTLSKRCQSPLNAVDAVNIAITGEGVIDGNGNAWRYVKKIKMTNIGWRDLLNSGGVLNDRKDLWFPNAGALKGSKTNVRNSSDIPLSEWEEIKTWLRPVMVSLVRCKNILLEGVSFQNSPSWNIHPLMCENLILDGVTVRNPWNAQNGDGLDLESCNNVLVVNSSFDVGDDAICVKSGKDEEGRKRGIPCQNVVVDNCRVFHGHGGFVVGSEMSGGARNIAVLNCQFLGTDVGLRFKSTRGRGGIVENIWIENISMVRITHEPLLFDLYYGARISPDAPPVEPSAETPQFNNITIRNIKCMGAKRAMFFNGLPEMPIRNVVIENSVIVSDSGAEFSEVDGVTLNNVTINNKNGEPVLKRNVRNLKSNGSLSLNQKH